MSPPEKADPANADVVKADIVVVNYRSGEYLQACIDGLLAQTETAFRVFLVDNSPETGEVDALIGLDGRFEILPQKDNLGFAAGCNLGAGQGSAPFLAMLNPDAAPEPDWLARLLNCMDDTGADMAGSTQLMTNDPTRLDGAGDAYAPFGVAWRGGFEKRAEIAPPTGYCFSPCAAASIYRRNVFKDVGGFDERFFCYMEDVDIAYRIRMRGGFGVQCKEAVVQHVGSASSGRASPFVIYHGTRNRVWTFLKNTPPVLFVAMWPLHVLVNIAFLIRSLRHQRLGITWEATRDGFRGWSWIASERKHLARTRSRGSFTLARAMTWSLFKLAGRLPDVRPLKPDQTR
ncbi:glycosyltransferase family 2 protein [Hyphobacterium sp.]|uniref:glycosyltransferase family 2 protein n=1 Tax=Hyphobacterium sp. TaxID=2004662 RepID=UPI003BAAEC73